jgi:hypothetical protein
VQGYNAQAAANERQIVVAAELTNSSADFGVSSRFGGGGGWRMSA